MRHERDGWVWPPVGTRFVLITHAATTKKKKNAAAGATRAEFSQHKWAFGEHTRAVGVRASEEFARF